MLASSALVLAALASGCASSSSRTAAAPSRPTAGLSRTAALPAGCALALAALPAAPPVTLAQSTADMHGLFAVAESLAGSKTGTPLSKRAAALAAQSTIVGLVLGMPEESKNVATWESDAESLRAFCAS